jgi:hypothetical protein
MLIFLLLIFNTRQMLTILRHNMNFPWFGFRFQCKFTFSPEIITDFSLRWIRVKLIYRVFGQRSIGVLLEYSIYKMNGPKGVLGAYSIQQYFTVIHRWRVLRKSRNARTIVTSGSRLQSNLLYGFNLQQIDVENTPFFTRKWRFFLPWLRLNSRSASLFSFFV